MKTYTELGLVYVQDSDGVVHLADESPLGGLVTSCDLFGPVTVVEPVPDRQVCPACRADADDLWP